MLKQLLSFLLQPRGEATARWMQHKLPGHTWAKIELTGGWFLVITQSSTRVSIDLWNHGVRALAPVWSASAPLTGNQPMRGQS